jgi:hypothetical protein
MWYDPRRPLGITIQIRFDQTKTLGAPIVPATGRTGCAFTPQHGRNTPRCRSKHGGQQITHSSVPLASLPRAHPMHSPCDGLRESTAAGVAQPPAARSWKAGKLTRRVRRSQESEEALGPFPPPGSPGSQNLLDHISPPRSSDRPDSQSLPTTPARLPRPGHDSRLSTRDSNKHRHLKRSSV